MDLKFSIAFLCLAVIELTAAASLEDCPASLPRDRYLRVHGDSCYLFVTDHLRTFSTAERECEQRGGHLVIIRNAETQNFLYLTLKDEFHYRDVVWIGLSDHVTEGHWVWVDGTPASFTNWGQPGLFDDLMGCAAMDVTDNGDWKHFRCSLFQPAQHFFVCEYPIVKHTTMTTTTNTPKPTTPTQSVVPNAPASTSSSILAKTTPPPATTSPMSATKSSTPATTSPMPATTSPTPATTVTAAAELTAAASLEDCPASLPRDRYLRAHGDSCYLFVIGHLREFSTAERECEQRGGHLVIIRNAETQNFLYLTLKDEFHYMDVVWIGLSDHVTEGHWVWVDGTPASFTNWGFGQPGLLGGLKDCAAMDVTDNGDWKDFRCSGLLFLPAQHFFVCEYPIVKHTTMTTTTTTPKPTSPTQSVVPKAPASTSASMPAKTTPPPATTSPTPATTSPMPATATTSSTPAATSPMPATTSPTPATTVTAATGCPPFTCSLNCGLTGYKTDSQGCMLCVCDV